MAMTYTDRLLLACASGLLTVGGLAQVDVQHSEDCDVWEGRVCSCEPDITVLHGGRIFSVGPQGDVTEEGCTQ